MTLGRALIFPPGTLYRALPLAGEGRGGGYRAIVLQRPRLATAETTMAAAVRRCFRGFG